MVGLLRNLLMLRVDAIHRLMNFLRTSLWLTFGRLNLHWLRFIVSERRRLMSGHVVFLHECASVECLILWAVVELTWQLLVAFLPLL